MNRKDYSISHDELATIECCGDNPVIIDKFFGPQIFAPLRITADTKTNEWIIEREIIKDSKYIEWARIPGQYNEEFTDWDKED